MQPHNPMLDTYRNLVGEVLDRGRGLLTSSVLRSENEKDSAALRRAKTEWQPIPRLLQQIDDAVVTLGENVFTISLDDRLTPEAKGNDIEAAAHATKALVSTNADDIRGRVTRILDVLRADAYPARPLPADAIQEAQLAGIKGDLRMVWDSVTDDSDFIGAMSSSLRRAIGDGDALSTWLLASTHWPEDYLKSRGAEVRVASWQHEVATVLDGLSPTDLGAARRTYRLLADGRDGLPLLATMFNELGQIIDDLTNWRPSSWEPTPWSRAS